MRETVRSEDATRRAAGPPDTAPDSFVGRGATHRQCPDGRHGVTDPSGSTGAEARDSKRRFHTSQRSIKDVIAFQPGFIRHAFHR